MIIDFSLNSFDLAFWVSSTNIRHLMEAAVAINANVGQVENNIEYIEADLSDIKDQLMKGDQDLLDVLKLLEQHIENQSKINENFLAAFKNVADILADHEKRIQALEGGG